MFSKTFTASTHLMAWRDPVCQRLTRRSRARGEDAPQGARHLASLIAALAAALIVSGSAASAASAASSLGPDQTLASGESLWSPDGRYRLIMQDDGNLVEYQYNPYRVVWNSQTRGNWGAVATMQGDGNFVVYGQGHVRVWDSQTAGRGASVLALQDDGNAVIYGPAGATWSVYTGLIAPAGIASYPLGQRGPIIGTPYRGTHRLGNWQSDNAVDIAVPVGIAMLAMDDGNVIKVRSHAQDGGRFAGDQITVRGAHGNLFFYAHGRASVGLGQPVRRGQVIGTSGSANGVAHLHFAVRDGDPRDVMR